MEEGFDKNGMDREEIFSKSVRAGKRTYFFDVKSTKGNDYYLTITEKSVENYIEYFSRLYFYFNLEGF